MVMTLETISLWLRSLDDDYDDNVDDDYNDNDNDDVENDDVVDADDDDCSFDMINDH